MEDVPFIIKEKRYRIINDEVVEVMYKIVYSLICLIQKIFICLKIKILFSVLGRLQGLIFVMNIFNLLLLVLD